MSEALYEGLLFYSDFREDSNFVCILRKRKPDLKGFRE